MGGEVGRSALKGQGLNLLQHRWCKVVGHNASHMRRKSESRMSGPTTRVEYALGAYQIGILHHAVQIFATGMNAASGIIRCDIPKLLLYGSLDILHDSSYFLRARQASPLQLHTSCI